MMYSQVFWFTGLSGVGKTTVANSAKEYFVQKGQRVLVLDGDNVRHELHRQLGFSPSDIKENKKDRLITNTVSHGSGGESLVSILSAALTLEEWTTTVQKS